MDQNMEINQLKGNYPHQEPVIFKILSTLLAELMCFLRCFVGEWKKAEPVGIQAQVVQKNEDGLRTSR